MGISFLERIFLNGHLGLNCPQIRHFVALVGGTGYRLAMRNVGGFGISRDVFGEVE